MKKRIILFCISMILIYLAVSFVTLKFDFRQWTENARVLYVIFGTCFSIGISTIPLIDHL